MSKTVFVDTVRFTLFHDRNRTGPFSLANETRAHYPEVFIINLMRQDIQTITNSFKKMNLTQKFIFLSLVIGSIAWGFFGIDNRNLNIPANTEIELILYNNEGSIKKGLFVKGHKVIDEGNFVILIPPDLYDKHNQNQSYTEVTVISNFFDKLNFTLNEPIEKEALESLSNKKIVIKAYNKYQLKLRRAIPELIKQVDQDNFKVHEGSKAFIEKKIADRVIYNFMKAYSKEQYDDSGVINATFYVTDKGSVRDIKIKAQEGRISDELDQLIKSIILKTSMPKLSQEIFINATFIL
jgi:hypothetical protein